MASTILDVALGISFVFVLLSVIASAVTEAISAMFSLRAQMLRRGIERLLNDRALADRIYRHPLIDGLTKDDDSDPAYIPSDLFARALVDVLKSWDEKTDRVVAPASRGVLVLLFVVPTRALLAFLRRLWPSASLSQRQAPKVVLDLEELRVCLKEQTSMEPHTRAVLLGLVADESVKTLEEALQRIAAWFDRAMESVSGWYKRSVTLLISFVALVMAVTLNVDTFVVADHLGRDAVLRASVAAAIADGIKADKADEKDAEAATRARVRAIQQGLDELTLPLGWPEDKPLLCKPSKDAPCDRRLLQPSLGAILRRIGGWLFTAIAISLGAPFWFDLLNKIINLRAASPPVSKAKSSSSSRAESTGSGGGQGGSIA